jgi:LacI family transcriptional regulator
MPTIKDVARQSGVSISTVSAVLNNSSWVPSDTKAHVQNTIKELGYRPNRVAQSLKKGHSNVVAVIVSDIANPYFTEVVSSLQTRLMQEQLNLVICNSNRSHDLGDKHFEFMLARQMDGIVIIGDSVTPSALERWQERDDVPVVAIERDYGIEQLPTLLVDSEQAAFEATSHLIEQGHTNIAMIAGPTQGVGSTTFGRSTRLEGYKRALETAGIAYKPHYVVEGDFQLPSGERAMTVLLNLAQYPTAVFAANDLMAIGAMKSIHAAGLRTREDIAVVGYDDISIASIITPSLTTLAMPKRELGEAAAEILLRRLRPSTRTGDVTDTKTLPLAPPPLRQIFRAALIRRDSA